MAARNRNTLLHDGELIEVRVNPSGNPNNFGSLFLPNPTVNTPSPLNPHPLQRPRQNQRHPQMQIESVIDLTTEPDSPVRSWRSEPQHQNARNPRRTNSQHLPPPPLSRSDSISLERSTSYIDLTEDSPAQGRSAAAYQTSGGRNIPPRSLADELIELEFISSGSRQSAPSFTIGLARRVAGFFSTDIIGLNQAQLDVSRNAFSAREPSPKPPMEPIPPTRAGFTRNTCTDPEKESEDVIICPACSEELAYDPTETAVPTGGSRGKRKRASGEHHFWALKKCGHVYCADCFENRKPTKSNRDGVGFRAPEGKHPYHAGVELMCAVEDCETKISSKMEWVGIFA